MVDLRALVALVLLGSGCAHRLTDFTVISTKSLSTPVEKGKRVKGEDCGAFSVDLKQAIDKAIESAGNDGDMLIDGVVTQVDYPFWTCYQVEGNIAGGRKSAAETPAAVAATNEDETGARRPGRQQRKR